MTEDKNSVTLQAYEKAVDKYIDKTPKDIDQDPALKRFIDESLAGLDASSRILEIGSGFGRDADYMESKGYKVQRTDAAQGFVDYIRQSGGHDVYMLNALTDEFEGLYDLIFANAVLIHFAREDLARFFTKVVERGLAPSGRLAFSVKIGEGEEWSTHKLDEQRFFCYWTKESIEACLHKAGFAWWQIDTDNPFGREAKWLCVVAYV